MSLIRGFVRHPNSEHEQALVRIGIALLIVLFVVVNVPLQQRSLTLQSTIGFFIVLSSALLLHIGWRPPPSTPRRVIGILNDVGGVTCAMLYAGELGVAIYLFYLWITFGNGFRFGKSFLYVSLVSSLCGFSVVLLRVGYWQQHLSLGLGLWIGMVLVGLYFSTLVERLTTALQREEAANQAKRSFISSVSHELRTPLNAIIGMANLLQSTTLNREQTDMVKSLDNASHLMLALIEDVLDFSKIEAGKLLIEDTDFDLHQLINSTVDIFTYQASARGLELVVQIAPEAPYALRGDPHHLRQVLVNLMSNAIKFTERGRIVLRIECMADTGQFALLHFEVEDTGIGIAPAAQKKVFDSFTQADDSTSRRYGGTGLGTTISRQLVELMGGQLGLRSEIGVGSTFWFELDLQKQRNAPVAVATSAPAACRTLLVGFDGEQLGHAAGVLESMGMHYQSALNSNHALTVLRNARMRGEPFDLMLLDAGTVRASGTDDDVRLLVLRQTVLDVQQAAGYSEFPVLLADAALAQRNPRQRLAEQAGLVNVLQLPLQAEHLRNALHARVAFVPVDAPPVAVAMATPWPTAAHAYRVLVAEDNATNRLVIEKMLQRAGHHCTLAEDGEQALDQLDHQEFDAVVVDMNMPVMNGLEATRAMRMMSLGRHLPIIMLSADVTAETKAECEAAGIDKFLPKPIQIDLLLATLDELIALHGSAVVRPVAAPQPATLLLQPTEDEVVLNLATLAELDALGQNPRFLDGLIEGFMADAAIQMACLDQALADDDFTQFKDGLHALKGSAMSIGAVALRTTCACLESSTQAELRRDAVSISVSLHEAWQCLRTALESYQRQRRQGASQAH